MLQYMYIGYFSNKDIFFYMRHFENVQRSKEQALSFQADRNVLHSSVTDSHKKICKQN